jgi:hypothetical protein
MVVRFTATARERRLGGFLLPAEPSAANDFTLCSCSHACAKHNKTIPSRLCLPLLPLSATH